jgi:hypothetical protein
MEIDQPVRCQIRHMLNPDKLGALMGRNDVEMTPHAPSRTLSGPLYVVLAVRSGR